MSECDGCWYVNFSYFSEMDWIGTQHPSEEPDADDFLGLCRAVFEGKLLINRAACIRLEGDAEFDPRFGGFHYATDKRCIMYVETTSHDYSIRHMPFSEMTTKERQFYDKVAKSIYALAKRTNHTKEPA